MNSKVMAALTVFVAAAIAQRYKVINLQGGIYSTFYMHEYGIFPQDDKLIFEMKMCTSGKVWIILGIGTNWIYQFHMLLSDTGKITIQAMKFATAPSSIVTFEDPRHCNKFHKFKVGWRNGNLGVWVYDKRGWIKILEWVDQKPRLDDVKNITMTEHGDIVWKVYALEHSTSPYKVTCVEF